MAVKEEEEADFFRRVAENCIEGLTEMDAGSMGRGVATTKEFVSGQYVATYQGEVISHKEAEARFVFWLAMSRLCFFTPKSNFSDMYRVDNKKVLIGIITTT